MSITAETPVGNGCNSFLGNQQRKGNMAPPSDVPTDCSESKVSAVACSSICTIEQSPGMAKQPHLCALKSRRVCRKKGRQTYTGINIKQQRKASPLYISDFCAKHQNRGIFFLFLFNASSPITGIIM